MYLSSLSNLLPGQTKSHTNVQLDPISFDDGAHLPSLLFNKRMQCLKIYVSRITLVSHQDLVFTSEEVDHCV